MLYKKVDRINEELSTIGIGCWNFGGEWDRPDEKAAEEIVATAVGRGVNLFDVAPIYGKYHAEEVLGRALAQGGLRQKVMVATKGGLPIAANGSVANNLSYNSLMEEVEGSLRRLRTDCVDIYQLHWPDPSTPLEETARALEGLKQQGKIRYIGLSNFSKQQAETMMELVGVDTQQSLYNMLERNTDRYHDIPLTYKTEIDVLPAVRKYGQAFFPYSPLFQGLLAGRFTRGRTFSAQDVRNANPKLTQDTFESYRQCAEKIQAVADSLGHPVSELALNWLRQKPEVTSIIAGVSSVEQLEKNLFSLLWDIPEDAMAEINAIIEPYRMA